MFLRSPYNYDRAAVSRQTGLKCEDPTRAQQSGKEEADINTIVKRFGVTGMLPQRAGVPIQDIDFGEVFDFQSAMNVVVQAERAFMDIPADIRLRFGNDPGEFVKFAADPDNFDEMVKLGLANPPPKPDPTPANPALPDTPKGWGMYESLIRMLERRIARQESALADTRRELEGARAAAAAAIASTQKPLPLETPPKASKGWQHSSSLDVTVLGDTIGVTGYKGAVAGPLFFGEAYASSEASDGL